MDVIGAAVALVVTLPLWAFIAVALLVTQGRPIFYRQQRIGRGHRPFMLLKFRTMRAGTPPRLPDRPVAKQADDPRITSLGRVLRRTELDELPQLINVLRGEMSMVGPRPLPAEDLAQPGWLAEAPEAERTRRMTWVTRRHQVLPGLTGLWQVTHNNAADFDNWIICDLNYVEHQSLALDLRILLCTPFAMIRGRQQAEPGKDEE